MDREQMHSASIPSFGEVAALCSFGGRDGVGTSVTTRAESRCTRLCSSASAVVAVVDVSNVIRCRRFGGDTDRE
jgi:hypothetical protein